MKFKMRINHIVSCDKEDKLVLSAFGIDSDINIDNKLPVANIDIDITNPELVGKYKPGQLFEVEFKEIK